MVCMVFFMEERQEFNKYGIYLYKSCAQATENDNQKREERKESMNLIKEGKYVCRHGKNSE